MQLTRVQLDYEAKHKLKLSSGGKPITDCENVPGTKIILDDFHCLNKPQVKQTGHDKAGFGINMPSA